MWCILKKNACPPKPRRRRGASKDLESAAADERCTVPVGKGLHASAVFFSKKIPSKGGQASKLHKHRTRNEKTRHSCLVFSFFVRGRGFEPPRLTAHAPQACLATSYNTRASFSRICQDYPRDFPTIANIFSFFNLLRERHITFFE